MAIVALIFTIASMIIIATSGDHDNEKLLSTPISSSRTVPVLPDFFLFHQREKNNECNEINCLNDVKLDKNIEPISQLSNRFEEPTFYLQDYDWSTQNNEKELFQKRNHYKQYDSFPGHHQPCDCEVVFVVRDLGVDHYPRYLGNAVCSNSNMNSHRCPNCKSIMYNIRVLTLRYDMDQQTTDDRQPVLPEPLRSKYQFKTIETAVGCQCVKLTME